MSEYLTKSLIVCGLQCPKRLWMSKHKPLTKEKAKAVLEMGTDVGKCAHNLFPGGQIVESAPWEHDAAVCRTQELMDNSEVPAVFEAAFEFGNVRVRVDIMERLSRNHWRLHEVKASTELKDVHVQDIAAQTWTVKQAGYRIESANLLHIDKTYVRGVKGIEWKNLFNPIDVSADIKPLVKDMPMLVDNMLSVLRAKTMPKVEVSDHCQTPYACEFWERCTANKPKDWIVYLPHLSAKKRDELKDAGIEAITKIPKTFPLSERQRKICDVISSGKEWVSDELAAVLKEIEPPCFYLDFETMNPAIPLYEGTSPYQRLPFQWSLHHIGSRGKLSHWEFLADGHGDPRRPFSETLIKALSVFDAPIVVYSGFENSVLRDMADLYPDLAKPIVEIQNRLFDLLSTVRGHYCHPEFMGSYSIKDVGPVLAPDITYENLKLVANGGEASSVFAALASGAIQDKATIEKLRKALLDYCEIDTLAMVRVHEALRSKLQ